MSSSLQHRVLVTGGAGFVGSHLVNELMNVGARVAVYDFFHQYIWPVSPTYVENMEYRRRNLLWGAAMHRGSTRDAGTLRRFVHEFAPTCVVHLAALPLANVSDRSADEAFANIVQGTLNLLEILRDCPCKLVYISSSMVYGDFEQDPMPEEGCTEPKGIYGSMKLMGELLVKAYGNRYGIPWLIIRPSAVYGPSDNNQRVLQIFLENAIQRKPFGYVPGERLDFTFVEDVAQGIMAAVCCDIKNLVFNITRGEARTLAEAVAILRGICPNLECYEMAADLDRPRRGALDISKARVLLDYEPQVSLEEGIERYMEHMRTWNRSLFSH